MASCCRSWMQIAIMVSIGTGTMATTVASHSREKLGGQGVTWRLRRQSSICMLACMLCTDMSSCVKLYLAAKAAALHAACSSHVESGDPLGFCIVHTQRTHMRGTVLQGCLLVALT